MTWTGTDIFGRPLMAVVGKDGSIIVTRAADEEEEDEGAVLSFNHTSAAALALWIRQQTTPTTRPQNGG